MFCVFYYLKKNKKNLVLFHKNCTCSFHFFFFFNLVCLCLMQSIHMNILLSFSILCHLHTYTSCWSSLMLLDSSLLCILYIFSGNYRGNDSVKIWKGAKSTGAKFNQNTNHGSATTSCPGLLSIVFLNKVSNTESCLFLFFIGGVQFLFLGTLIFSNKRNVCILWH